MKKLSTGAIVGLVVLGVVVITVLWSISSYNSMIRLGEDVKTAQANVEAQYQRRFDLIPNLVNSVQGIFKQEQDIFNNLAEARSKYAGTSAGTPGRVDAINGVESALGRLLVVMENYPDLRSAQNVSQFQDQLEGTENRIAVERRRYNETVNAFNKRIKFFPGNIIAGMFGFDEYPRFESTEGADAAPVVDFDVL
jgi:LemA protein